MQDTSQYAVCACNHCSQHLEFRIEQTGESVECPNCGIATVLYQPRVSEGTHRPSRKSFPKLKIGFLLGAIVICLAGMSGALLLKRDTGPEGVVRRYLQVTRWDERLSYVRNAQAILPFMADYYRSAKFPIDFVAIKPAQKLTYFTHDWWAVPVVMAKGKNGFGAEVETGVTYYVTRVDKDFQVDWEASLVRNPMSWAEFRTALATAPQKRRFLAQLDYAYPNDPLTPGALQDKYWSVAVTGVDSDGSEQYLNLHAYVTKESVSGKNLFAIIKDGNKHPVICLVRHPQPGRDDESLFYNLDHTSVMIDRFVQEYWIEE
jgi:DNA-directed RNA polymerase subunit RPC12/RpoP